MEEHTFYLTYPVFLVVEDEGDGNYSLNLLDVNHDGLAGEAFPIFTEELHGERWRDDVYPNHSLMELLTRESLLRVLKRAADDGATHVAIDPKDRNQDACAAVAIPIEDAIDSIQRETHD